MNPADFLPSSDSIKGVQGIEQALESRRYTSRWSLVGAIVSAVFQLALLLHLGPASFRFPAVIPLVIAVLAAVSWALWKYTGFLFTRSQEPFRYTFWIKEFSQVAATPGERCSLAKIDQLKLLRYDLIERLDSRVRRFSFVETPASAPGSAPGANAASTPARNTINPASHFHIEGDYAIREESGGWILHVWPRVRIGLDPNPFTLAFPIRLALGGAADPDSQAPAFILQVDDYERLVERIYSSVATRIYEQIGIDLREKMTLFPTSTLRALARYYEAEDFENSNTIDAYDRALEMYQLSLDELNASWWHRRRSRLGERWPRLLSSEWTGIRATMNAEAKTRLGYSRCLTYRRLVSEMAGRKRNSIFKARAELEKAREGFRTVYNSFIREESLKIPSAFFTPNDPETGDNAGFQLARASFLEPAAWQPARKQLYKVTREEFCEAFAVSALAHSQLMDSENAENFLRFAEALAMNSGSNRALLLLVKAELEASPVQKVNYLNEARELRPDSEIVLYRLAYYSDLLARDNNEITAARVRYLSQAYEAVLKINPANILSLIGQGYLFWLVDDLESARAKLSAGIELPKVVSQTFVGDLNYCMARVEVELAAKQLAAPGLADRDITNAIALLNRADFDYREATAAEPSVAAGYVDSQGNSRNTYYELINRQMLARYKTFAGRTADISAFVAGPQCARWKNEELVRTADALRSCALNDYGNACLNYYLRFDLWSDRDNALNEALNRFEQSVNLQPHSWIAAYNWFCALNQTTDSRRDGVADRLLQSGVDLSPAALASIAYLRAQRQNEELSALAGEMEKLPEQIQALLADIKTLEASVESLRGTERARKDEELARKKQEHTEKQHSLQQKRERQSELEKKRAELEQRMLRLAAGTSLGAFSRHLQSDRIGDLLQRPDVNWSAFGDTEFYTLAGLAQLWSSDRKGASRQLCEHLLKSYYPEYFDLVWTLHSITSEPGERKRLRSVIDKAIAWSQTYDPKSYRFRAYRLSSCDESLAGSLEDWPYRFSEGAPYEDAIAVYQKVEDQCADFPSFHDSLAQAHEYRARQLAGDAAEHEAAREHTRLVVEERRKASTLAPRNRDFRDNLLTSLGRQWTAGTTFDDPLEQRNVPKLMDVEISTESVTELGFTLSGVPADLQQRILGIRKDLKADHGFTLPGINFRDNNAFTKGEFRLFIRGVPLAREKTDPQTPAVEQYEHLAKRIREAGLTFAARLYTSQDSWSGLNEIGRQDLQNDSALLFALTAVIRKLLSEGVPVSDFGAIVSEFQRCASLNLGLTVTAEEIRALPQIRARLRGNTPHTAVVRSLNQSLEDRLCAAVDWGCAEPAVTKAFELGREVSAVALKAALEAGSDHAVLLTSPELRPIVYGMVHGCGVSVLSRREILPALLSRTTD